MRYGELRLKHLIKSQKSLLKILIIRQHDQQDIKMNAYNIQAFLIKFNTAMAVYKVVSLLCFLVRMWETNFFQILLL